MTKEEGLKEIDEAQWFKDTYDCLNLFVHTKEGHEVHCWLSLRPEYCDRGHIQLNIVLRPFNVDDQDSFPRYFFTAEEAKHHTKVFLKWRLWQHRTYPHVLE